MMSRRIPTQEPGPLPASCVRCQHVVFWDSMFACTLTGRKIHQMTPPPEWCPNGGEPC